MIWQIGKARSIDCDKAKVMGILNVTPDSFSDGGDFFDPLRAMDRAEEMAGQGANIIDIGGESTRPFAEKVSEKEERRRVIPLIEKLIDRIPIPISIDTQKPEIARLAISSGASIVNDISAISQNEKMLEIISETGCGYIAMHMKGTPQTMQCSPSYENVVDEIDRCFAKLLSRFSSFGISHKQIVLDVGIGFGKTPAHNLSLLKNIHKYKKHARPLLLGASRKSFIQSVLGIERACDRGAASLACVAWGMAAGMKIFRVHDVLETSHIVQMWQAIESLS